jgi:nitrogen regulatory protein P-II 1
MRASGYSSIRAFFAPCGGDNTIFTAAIPRVAETKNAWKPSKTTMTKIEAIIQTAKLDPVKEALHEIGVEGMTVLEARGHGRQKGHTEFYRGREYTVDLIPKTKIELVVADDVADKVVRAIVTAARTGKIGDGKIFTSRIDDAVRIRNDERGDSAL